MMRKEKPVLYDPLIIPRVKQYLEENVHQTYVDVAVMARQLQERYREYNRRRSAPFRMLVEQAYKTVLHSYGLDSNPSSEDGDNDGNSDLEVMDDSTTAPNHLNNMMTNMYTKNKPPNNTNSSNTNELIDISSDESGDGDDSGRSALKKLQLKTKSKDGMVTIKRLEKGTTIPTIVSGQAQSQVLAPPPTPISQQPPPLHEKPPLDPSDLQVPKKRKIDGQKFNAAKPVNGSTGMADEATPSRLSNLPRLRKEGTRKEHTRKEFFMKFSRYSFRDIGGLDKVLKELCELLMHIKHPEVYMQIGTPPPRGFLLHGPPGCGKTLLANAIAGQLHIGIIEVQATELIAGVSGESEERIRDVFEQAAELAPCVLFIDDIDAISANRLHAQRDMERRIVSQLIGSLDKLAKHDNGDQVVVIGATTRPEALDPALRRVGRFDNEISLGVPDRDEREEILIIVTENLSLQAPFDFQKVAELTPGYVGADIVALAARAATLAIKRCLYKKQQMKKNSAKNIPIVDLVDESVVESEDVGKKDGQQKEVKDNEKEKSGDKESSDKADKEEEKKDEENLPDSTKTNGDVSSSNEDIEVVNDEETGNAAKNLMESLGKSTADSAEKVDEKSPTESSEKPKDVVEVMDVDKSLESVEDEGTKKTDTTEEKKVTEEIEVSEKEKPDETKTAETRNKDDAEEPPKIDSEKTEALDEPIDVDEIPDPPQKAKKSKRQDRGEFTLTEMMSWLTSESQPIEDSILDDLFVSLEDFLEAIKLVKPSAKREGFITVPDVTWDDIGSLKDIREELQVAVLAPVKFPEKLKVLGLTTPAGVLLCGPPGCGKTLLAKAIANEAGINFISVKGPELMNMYVGESERGVRQCFQRARNSAPCVIFFDEFDSLCPKRSDSNDSGSGTRVVNQLLTEMDGIEDRKGVYLMAATNRPDIIDPAVLRPGRLDKVLYVGLPELQDRVEILEAITKHRQNPPLAEDVVFNEIASQTDGFSGADLAGLIRQASLLALKDSMTSSSIPAEDLQVNKTHIDLALSHTRPSVTAEDQMIYEKLKLKYSTQ